MSAIQPDDQAEQTAQMAAKVGLQFTLHVHLDDGTVKDIPCVAEINSIERVEGN